MAIRKYKPTTPGRRGAPGADFVEITRTTPAKSLPRPLPQQDGRNTHARSIFNLNAEYADAMETLNALSSFYHHLPKAHQDLADGLARHGKPQKALAELAAFADHVARLTRDLEKSR